MASRSRLKEKAAFWAFCCVRVHTAPRGHEQEGCQAALHELGCLDKSSAEAWRSRINDRPLCAKEVCNVEWFTCEYLNGISRVTGCSIRAQEDRAGCQYLY